MDKKADDFDRWHFSALGRYFKKLYVKVILNLNTIYFRRVSQMNQWIIIKEKILKIYKDNDR